jgi:DNA-binding CsgD family transcriptional regulator
VVAAILHGLLQATGASGCRLCLQLLPDGPEADYELGRRSSSAPLVVRLEAESFRGFLRLFDAGTRPAASPAALECLRPMIEGALLALIDRSNASRQIDILVQILGVANEAHLLMDERGEILFANARGEELLALHTEQPQARLANGDTAPLLSLIVSEIGALVESNERVRRQALATGDGGRWRLEIVALAGLGGAGYSLVVLTPIRLLQPEEIRQRCSGVQVSRREAEVLAFLLRGQKASEIATRLGITEYTVKDHLKHAYAKLGITSRGQLLTRLEAADTGTA